MNPNPSVEFARAARRGQLSSREWGTCGMLPDEWRSQLYDMSMFVLQETMVRAPKTEAQSAISGTNVAEVLAAAFMMGRRSMMEDIENS